MSNVVDTNNIPGAMQLIQNDPEATFAEDLLNAAERYGLYLATLLDQSDMGQDSMNIVADNICE